MPARPNRRTAFWLTLMLAAAAVATAAALLQWVGLHRASKPLVTCSPLATTTSYSAGS